MAGYWDWAASQAVNDQVADRRTALGARPWWTCDEPEHVTVSAEPWTAGVSIVVSVGRLPAWTLPPSCATGQEPAATVGAAGR